MFEPRSPLPLPYPTSPFPDAGHLEVVRLLLAKKADVKFKNKHFINALHGMNDVVSHGNTFSKSPGKTVGDGCYESLKQ